MFMIRKNIGRQRMRRGGGVKNQEETNVLYEYFYIVNIDIVSNKKCPSINKYMLQSFMGK